MAFQKAKFICNKFFTKPLMPIRMLCRDAGEKDKMGLNDWNLFRRSKPLSAVVNWTFRVNSFA